MGRQIAILSTVLIILTAVMSGCSSPAKPEPAEEIAASAIPKDLMTSGTDPTADDLSPESTSPTFTVPEHEIELVAKTLRGECYDDQPDDKREVVKVICNRVSAGGFGGSVEAVITAPKQFIGYRPGNVPTENDYIIAREVLEQWYESGCAPLGEYLFFSSVGNYKNVFRKEWKEAQTP